MKISDHEDLHAAKGLIIAALLPEDRIHAVEQVGPHHTDLVNDQKIKAFDGLFFLPAESEHAPAAGFMGVTARDERPKGKLKKGM